MEVKATGETVLDLKDANDIYAYGRLLRLYSTIELKSITVDGTKATIKFVGGVKLPQETIDDSTGENVNIE